MFWWVLEVDTVYTGKAKTLHLPFFESLLFIVRLPLSRSVDIMCSIFFVVQIVEFRVKSNEVHFTSEFVERVNILNNN